MTWQRDGHRSRATTWSLTGPGSWEPEGEGTVSRERRQRKVLLGPLQAQNKWNTFEFLKPTTCISVCGRYSKNIQLPFILQIDSPFTLCSKHLDKQHLGRLPNRASPGQAPKQAYLQAQTRFLITWGACTWGDRKKQHGQPLLQKALTTPSLKPGQVNL